MNRYVHRVEDIPKVEHWAIVSNTSVFVPGDERSRTAPGHGYPERTERFIEYLAFDTESEFLLELQKRYEKESVTAQEFRGIHVAGVFVRHVSVGVAKAATI